MESIAICICTYKRHERLRSLLSQLVLVNRPTAYQIKIIVVDNDPSGSASEILPDFPDVHYFVEHKTGVSFARNRAITEAKRFGADFVAFLDDDEIPSENWLIDMISVLKNHHADVVAGPVIPILSDSTKVFLPFMTRKRHVTGTLIHYWGAGNVLLHVNVFDRIGFFSDAYALQGGEDTQFSARCKKHGLRMIWADSAVVFEPTGQDRANPKWISDRAFNAGRIISKVEIELDIGNRQRRIAIAIFYFVIGVAGWPASLIVDKLLTKNYNLSARVSISKGLGMLRGLLPH